MKFEKYLILNADKSINMDNLFYNLKQQFINYAYLNYSYLNILKKVSPIKLEDFDLNRYAKILQKHINSPESPEPIHLMQEKLSKALLFKDLHSFKKHQKNDFVNLIEDDGIYIHNIEVLLLEFNYSFNFKYTKKEYSEQEIIKEYNEYINKCTEKDQVRSYLDLLLFLRKKVLIKDHFFNKKEMEFIANELNKIYKLVSRHSFDSFLTDRKVSSYFKYYSLFKFKVYDAGDLQHL